MGYDISAYVEKKDGDKWVLVSERPISSRLKYIIDDYKDFNGLNWDDLSDGLKGIFKKDEDGKVYHNFYVARIEDIEAKIAGKIKESYVRLFGKEPLVLAIHAGLECGLFSDKYPR